MSDLITEDKNLSVFLIYTPFSPTGAFPMDDRIYFNNLEAAKDAARNAGEIGSNKLYFYGMKLCVDDGNSVTWYTIQRNGDLLADDKDGSTVSGIQELVTDEKGIWYRMHYTDGQSIDFCAPEGYIVSNFQMKKDTQGECPLLFSIILPQTASTVPPRLVLHCEREFPNAHTPSE